MRDPRRSATFLISSKIVSSLGSSSAECVNMKLQRGGERVVMVSSTALLTCPASGQIVCGSDVTPSCSTKEKTTLSQLVVYKLAPNRSASRRPSVYLPTPGSPT